MKSMNLIHLMNYAWERRVEDGLETLQKHFTNLISHAYAKMSDICRREYEIQGREYNDFVFYVFQDLLVYIMKTDGDLLNGEYDAYKSFCNYAYVVPLSVNDVNALYQRKTVDDLVKRINYIKSFRREIDDNQYEAMILSFCYFCLLGDRAFDENEYYILRCFFDEDYDYCPKDWNTFKKEWK